MRRALLSLGLLGLLAAVIVVAYRIDHLPSALLLAILLGGGLGYALRWLEERPRP